ncbi:hypothetical protein HDU78_008514 [Chytriomyces hyalinus]|nr:hypothetical protein HDU78_008514 [Chytriomyces hyalinus]
MKNEHRSGTMKHNIKASQRYGDVLLKGGERETLSMAVLAYLFQCMQPSVSADAAVTMSPYWDYIYSITLATTAPVAAIHLSLVYTRLMLDALPSQKPIEERIILGDLICLWSLAIIIADLAVNGHEDSETGWARALGADYELPDVMESWQARTDDLFDDFSDRAIQIEEFVAFLEGRSDPWWKACCDANRDIAALNSALRASIPIQMPLQKLTSPIIGAIEDLSGTPVPADKARHNSVLKGGSSPDRVENSAKYEPYELNASTLSTSNNSERFRPLCRMYDHIEHVWIAKDLKTKDKVVLKYVYSREKPFVNDTKAYQSNMEVFGMEVFSMEVFGMEVFGVRVLSELNPSRIINFISCYRHSESRVVLAMELAHCSLAEALLLRPKLTESETKGVIRCLLEALVACHSLNIVHRNVNPENMFLFSNDLNSLKLGGFGMCVKDDGQSTCTGLIGSKGFIAPEQTNTTQYGTLVDIWATGVTMCQLLYGCLPHLGFTAMLPMDWPELLFPVTSNISKEGIRFIRLLLSVNPKNRPTASEALQHAWFTGTAPVIRDKVAPSTPKTHSHDSAQTTIPTLATNHIPIHIPPQKLTSPIDGAIEELSSAPAPADKARHNSVLKGGSSPARVEESTKYEPYELNASTLSTSNNSKRFRPLCRLYDHIENVWIAKDLKTKDEVLLKYVYSREKPFVNDTKAYQSNMEVFDMEVFGVRVLSDLNPSRIINFMYVLCAASDTKTFCSCAPTQIATNPDHVIATAKVELYLPWKCRITPWQKRSCCDRNLPNLKQKA